METETPSLEALLPNPAPKIIQNILSYWENLRGDRLFPSFHQIDPIDIPWALHEIYVVQLLDEGDFAYRLAGEGVVGRYGKPLKGVRITDIIANKSAETITQRWRRIITEPAACYTETLHRLDEGEELKARRLTLPLGPVDGNADHVLGLVAFDRTAPLGAVLTKSVTVETVRWAPVGPAG